MNQELCWTLLAHNFSPGIYMVPFMVLKGLERNPLVTVNYILGFHMSYITEIS